MKIKFKLHHPAYRADDPFYGEVELDAHDLANLVTVVAAGNRIVNGHGFDDKWLEAQRAQLFALLCRPIEGRT